MTKICIFCGGRVNSEEHVRPQWLLTLMKKWLPSKSMKMHSARLNKSGTVEKWVVNNPEIVTKCVCRDCNSGWMSELEVIARPVILPLIEGTAKRITLSQQIKIIAWITKCAMIFDEMSGAHFFEHQECVQFRKDLITPVDHTEVWLGYYSGQHLGGYTHHGTGSNNAPPTPNKSYVQTMAFGRMVLQLIAIKPLIPVDVPVLRLKVRNGKWDHVTLRLATYQIPIRWPPKHSFDDSSCTIQDFADRFGLQRLE